jgi:peptide/nickel transport system substrate-binding protein
MRITRRGTLSLLAMAALPRAARAQARAPGLPDVPRVIDMAATGRVPGRQGGVARILVGGQRDVRLMPYYGYARMVGYDRDLNLVPDILRDVEVEEARVYTLHLRPGHRWSDGQPLTPEDFRYVWQDMMLNPDLYRGGVPTDMKADGKPCKFEIVDDLTVRYIWEAPKPDFLPKLASPTPIVLAMPSRYMRQFHAAYAAEADLAALIEEKKVDDWQGLHQKMGRQNRPENPDLPTLEPWRPTTAPPAERFVFERNPHFHRVDEAGTQLPYLNAVELHVVSAEVIAAKTATGDSDLQTQGIGFGDYTLLKHAEKAHPVKVALWKRTQGSAMVLCPNLTCADPVWRAVFRDVRVRRAMSVAIDRREINAVLFYGLGRESADTVLPESPLFRDEIAAAWMQHDPDLANALLDEAGLVWGRGGARYLPDGRKAGIVVETAGESTLETDMLELIADHWRVVGLPLYIRTSQRDIFRARALAGDVLMGVWGGLDNALATADMSPEALAPTAAEQLQWPLWGLHHASAEESGEAPDMPEAADLLRLYHDWGRTTGTAARAAIWRQMLEIRAEQVFTIGTVNGALQPVLRNARLRNVPENALYGFEPTSYFGAYGMDSFFMDEEA